MVHPLNHIINGKKYHQITKFTCCTLIIKLFFHLALTIYYNYSYFTIPKYIKKEKMSYFFLFYIIISYISNISIIIELIYTYRCMGFYVHKNLWNTIIPTNRYPLKFIDWSHIICISFGSYFITNFVPIIEHNCYIFTDISQHACRSLQMISIITIISLIYISFGLFLLLCIIISLCCRFRTPTPTSISREIRIGRLKNIVLSNILSYIPILFVSSKKIKMCDICLIEKPHNDDSPENGKWTIFNCTHKFHVECVKGWINQHMTCPVCGSTQPQLRKTKTQTTHTYQFNQHIHKFINNSSHHSNDEIDKYSPTNI